MSSSSKALDIIHQDSELVVINKPAGIAVHGGAGVKGKTILERLKEQLGADFYLIHRLDLATSGVLALARSAELMKGYAAQWSQAEKEYLCFALGAVKAPAFLNSPLKDKQGRTLACMTELLHAELLGALEPQISWIHIKLHTGRTHQIRRHLADQQHPVLMDDKYGDFKANKAFAKTVRAAGSKKPKHQMLHCWQLKLHSPGGKVLHFVADPPAQWYEVVHLSGGSVDGWTQVP